MANLAPDLSIFDKLKTFDDYNKINDQFQLQKAAAQQQLGTGALDQQGKQIGLVGQIVGNSTDQASYDKTRALASQSGLDTSFLPDTYSPELVQRLRFSGASPTSQLTAMIAANGQNLKAGLSTNNVGQYGFNPIQISGQSPTQVNTMTPSAVMGGTPIVPASTSTVPANGNNGPVAIAPSGSDPSAALALETLAPNTLPDAPASAIPQFRAQKPGETTAGYQAAQKAFENNNADIIANLKANAAQTGKTDSLNTEAASKAQELTERLRKNLMAMQQLNPDVPSNGLVMTADNQTHLSQGLNNGHPILNALFGDNGKGATAANQWDQINNQQIISEIQQFIASGGANVRVNQTLDKMIRAASGINKGDSADSRAKQINNALAEIENKNISIQNVASGGNTPYKDIPVGTGSPQVIKYNANGQRVQ